MVTRLFRLAFVMLLCVGVLAIGVTAKTKYDNADNVTKFSFPRANGKLAERVFLDDTEEAWSAPSRSMGRSGLGSANPGTESPGIVIRQTYDDWQATNRAPLVDIAGVPSIQFAYTDLQTEVLGQRGFGYNIYDPTSGGSWPRGIGVGCRVQPSDGEGQRVTISIDPDGLAILSGEDDAGGTIDNHFYTNIALHGCTWLGGSIIEQSQYNQGFMDPGDASNTLHGIISKVQLFGGDTITHAVGVEFPPDGVTWFPNAPALQPYVAQYFRKVNQGFMSAATTWDGPITIDTTNYRVLLISSRVSGKVAVVYLHPTPWASMPEVNERWDEDTYYRESDDAGVNWGPPVNVSNYDRSVPSYLPWVEVTGIYDADDFIHVLWGGKAAPAEYWLDPDYSRTAFQGVSLFHWSNRTGAITRVANRDYGYDLGQSIDCYGGTNVLELGFYSMSECNGRLYVLYSGWNDPWAEPPIMDDCASSAAESTYDYMRANGELYLHVSTTLDGVLWDAPRNLTNTYTPGCDSAGFGGKCADDTKSTLTPFGMDSAAWGQELTFPGTELVEIDPSYTGSHYLNLVYLQNVEPGAFAIGRGGSSWGINDLRWMRTGCIDPVSAPAIAYTPVDIGYPSYVNHGADTTITVTVANDGNTGLNVGTIGVSMTSPAGSWLTTSVASLTVGAGVNNTATFDVMLNADGNINSPGTIVALLGEVYMLSDAPAPRDSVSYMITNFIIADTVVGLDWDTVSTGTTRVVASSHGEMGGNGAGGLNLDFTGFGADCDSSGADVYMYSGGPMLMQVSGADTFMNFAMHQGTSFDAPESFKRDSDLADPADVSGANYEAFFTGTFLNWDSTIALEKTIYAPTGGGDSTNFIIQCMRVFPLDGMTHSNLAIGEMVDWDIPTDSGGNNAFVTVTGKTVYFQGYDIDPLIDSNQCQDNATRMAAQGFLGMYSNSEYNSDNCSNTSDFWGVYAGRNDSDLFYNTPDSVAERLWRNTLNKTGLNGLAETTDIHGVMTFVHGVDLAAGDTLTFYSVFTSVQDGNVAELEGHLSAACAWYEENLRPGCTVCGCCIGLTGNIDGSPDENPDLGDLTALIDYLFISFTVPTCFAEANVDGDPGGSVDLGDLTALIDYLFISFTPPAPCQ